MKILTIIGARPQFIKASIISSKIKFNYKSLTEVIIHTGQHYEKNMSQIFFDEMDLPEPKYNLGINSIEYGQMIHIMIKMKHNFQILSRKPMEDLGNYSIHVMENYGNK